MAAPAADHRAGLPLEEDDRLEGDESEEEEVESGEEGGDDWSEAASLADLCDPDAGSDEDPSFDPATGGGLEPEAALWSRIARMSISGRKDRKGSVAPKIEKEDIDLLAMVEKLMHDGQLEKLKVYECKSYLRVHKLRLSGKKEVLLNRITEHIEVKKIGDIKYPVSSFVLNCKGDACKGDIVMFEQNIYKRKKGAPREAKGRLCGQRTNAGRIIKESYGSAKQQHTFTIEILWSKGYKPWPSLHPFLIKGRNLYKDKTMRQPWPDEQERIRVLQEKHARGFQARKTRAVRIHEKEIENMRFNRIKQNKIKDQENMNQKLFQKVLPQQKTMSTSTVDQRSYGERTPSLQHSEPGNTRQQQISSKENPAKHLFHQQFPYDQRCNEVLPQERATRTLSVEFIAHQVPSVQPSEPEKTRQQEILLGPTPLQVLKHPQQENNCRPSPAQQMSKQAPQHNNHHQHNEVLLQDGITRTFSIPCQSGLQHGASGNTRQQQKYSKPTPTEQIKNSLQPPKYQDHNVVLPQEGAKRTYRVDSIAHQNTYRNTEHGKAPCLQHGGSSNTSQQQKSSTQQIQNLTQSPKHQHRNEVLATTHQHGSSGHQHAHADHQRRQPLSPRNQDFYSRNQSKSFPDHGQITREQYHPQQRRHGNQYGSRQLTQNQDYTQQIHHQNHRDSWRMNQYNYHPQVNNYHNFQYAQQLPLKPCHYYQRGLWCPYEKYCKFSHGDP